MAITFNNTSNELTANEKPSGYTDPTVTKFATVAGVHVTTLNLTVLKSTVENATASTTMTNIFNDATIGLNKQLSDIVSAAYSATPTVTAYGELVGLSNNFSGVNGDATYLKNTAASYTCTVKLYVKSV